MNGLRACMKYYVIITFLLDGVLALVFRLVGKWYIVKMSYGGDACINYVFIPYCRLFTFLFLFSVGSDSVSF